MQKFEEPVQNLRGDIIALAPMLVMVAGTETPATVFSDAAGQTPINELRTDRTGVCVFYAPNGRYDIYVMINGLRVGHKLDHLLFDIADSGIEARVDDAASAVQSIPEQLAATYGSSLVGNGAESVAESFNALQLSDYDALRQYVGPRKSVYVTGYMATTAPSGIAGMFVRDDSDTTSADNGGTVIVSTNGKRWKRPITGSVMASWFGILPSNSGAANAAAFTAAFAALGGTDFGYGKAPVSLIIDGTYNYSGALVSPVNVSLVAPSGAAIVSTSAIQWCNPSIIGGARGYTEYWPYMDVENVGVDFRCPIINNAFIGLSFSLCSIGDPAGAFTGLTLSNTNNLWTERTRLNACFLRGGGSGSVVRMTANVGGTSPGTSSFAYTEVRGCTVSLSGSAKLFDVIAGASLYGGAFELRGNATGTSTLFSTNNASIKDCSFDIRVEDDTNAGTPVLFALNGGQFWNNKGNITLTSYNFSCTETGGVTFRDNWIIVSGASFKDYWSGVDTITNSAAYTTVINASTVKRKPANLQYVDFFHAGVMTSAVNATAISASQFVGALPSGAKRILRVEIRARVAGSGNTGGKFYFDLRSGIGSGSFQYPLALTSIYLSDGTLLSNINLDQDISTGSDWILMAKPTDITPSGSNAGTAPTDVSMRVYFV